MQRSKPTVALAVNSENKCFSDIFLTQWQSKSGMECLLELSCSMVWWKKFEFEIEIERNAQQPNWTSITILENFM